MQPFVSQFPSAQQGWGLLTLRLVLTSFLLVDLLELGPALHAGQVERGALYMFATVQALLIFVVAAFVALGLLTSITHAVVVVMQIAVLCRASWAPDDLILAWQPWQARVCQAAMALGIALMGPGAYSLDAKLFGRREIHIPPRRH